MILATLRTLDATVIEADGWIILRDQFDGGILLDPRQELFTLPCVGGIDGIGGPFSTFFSTFLVSCAWKFIATRPRAKAEQSKILVMTRSP